MQIKIRNKAPDKLKTVYISEKSNEKYIRMLLLLNNNLMQLHNVPYNEILIQYEHPDSNEFSHIYFEPNAPMLNDDLYYINTVFVQYITYGRITKENMERANSVWKKLKNDAGVTQEDNINT